MREVAANCCHNVVRLLCLFASDGDDDDDVGSHWSPFANAMVLLDLF